MEINELNKNARGGTEQIHRKLDELLPADLKEKFQLIPSRVRDIDPNRKPILVLHDLPSDPESAHLRDEKSRKRFAGIVCVSHWQRDAYHDQLGVPFSEMEVLQNAIEPMVDRPRHNDGIVRLIYHTTPHRALAILVPVFEKLCEYFDNIELDVYSSFEIYGWKERDAQYEELFERCRNHPKIRYHGFVPNSKIRAALAQADIFSYPSIWPETSCIAAIEALSAGCTVVAPSYAALPETCANFALMYPYTEVAQEHAQRFATALAGAIQERMRINAGQQDPGKYRFQAAYFKNFYSWDLRKLQWQYYLRNRS